MHIKVKNWYYLRIGQERLSSSGFLLVRFLFRTSGILFFLLLLLFVFDELFLLLQNFEFLLVAGFLRINFELRFVQLDMIQLLSEGDNGNLGNVADQVVRQTTQHTF